MLLLKKLSNNTFHIQRLMALSLAELFTPRATASAFRPTGRIYVCGRFFLTQLEVLISRLIKKQLCILDDSESARAAGIFAARRDRLLRARASAAELALRDRSVCCLFFCPFNTQTTLARA